MKCLEVYGKPVPLHCVFHGIRFKVNGRLVVEMTTFFFLKRRVRVDAPLFRGDAPLSKLGDLGFTQVDVQNLSEKTVAEDDAVLFMPRCI